MGSGKSREAPRLTPSAAEDASGGSLGSHVSGKASDAGLSGQVGFHRLQAAKAGAGLLEAARESGVGSPAFQRRLREARADFDTALGLSAMLAHVLGQTPQGEEDEVLVAVLLAVGSAFETRCPQAQYEAILLVCANRIGEKVSLLQSEAPPSAERQAGLRAIEQAARASTALCLSSEWEEALHSSTHVLPRLSRDMAYFQVVACKLLPALVASVRLVLSTGREDRNVLPTLAPVLDAIGAALFHVREFHEHEQILDWFVEDVQGLALALQAVALAPTVVCATYAIGLLCLCPPARVAVELDTGGTKAALTRAIAGVVTREVEARGGVSSPTVESPRVRSGELACEDGMGRLFDAAAVLLGALPDPAVARHMSELLVCELQAADETIKRPLMSMCVVLRQDVDALFDRCQDFFMSTWKRGPSTARQWARLANARTRLRMFLLACESSLQRPGDTPAWDLQLDELAELVRECPAPLADSSVLPLLTALEACAQDETGFRTCLDALAAIVCGAADLHNLCEATDALCGVLCQLAAFPDARSAHLPVKRMLRQLLALSTDAPDVASAVFLAMRGALAGAGAEHRFGAVIGTGGAKPSCLVFLEAVDALEDTGALVALWERLDLSSTLLRLVDAFSAPAPRLETALGVCRTLTRLFARSSEIKLLAGKSARFAEYGGLLASCCASVEDQRRAVSVLVEMAFDGTAQIVLGAEGGEGEGGFAVLPPRAGDMQVLPNPEAVDALAVFLSELANAPYGRVQDQALSLIAYLIDKRAPESADVPERDRMFCLPEPESSNGPAHDVHAVVARVNATALCQLGQPLMIQLTASLERFGPAGRVAALRIIAALGKCHTTVRQLKVLLRKIWELATSEAALAADLVRCINTILRDSSRSHLYFDGRLSGLRVEAVRHSTQHGDATLPSRKVAKRDNAGLHWPSSRALSFSAWVKVLSTRSSTTREAPTAVLFEMVSVDGQSQLAMVIEEHRTLAVQVKRSGRFHVFRARGRLPAFEWVQVGLVATRTKVSGFMYATQNEEALEVFVNGQSVLQLESPFPFRDKRNREFRRWNIGCGADGVHRFHGCLHGVQFWSEPLSVADMQDVYKGNLSRVREHALALRLDESATRSDLGVFLDTSAGSCAADGQQCCASSIVPGGTRACWRKGARKSMLAVGGMNAVLPLLALECSGELSGCALFLLGELVGPGKALYRLRRLVRDGISVVGYLLGRLSRHCIDGHTLRGALHLARKVSADWLLFQQVLRDVLLNLQVWSEALAGDESLGATLLAELPTLCGSSRRLRALVGLPTVVNELMQRVVPLSSAVTLRSAASAGADSSGLRKELREHAVGPLHGTHQQSVVPAIGADVIIRGLALAEDMMRSVKAAQPEGEELEAYRALLLNATLRDDDTLAAAATIGSVVARADAEGFAGAFGAPTVGSNEPDALLGLLLTALTSGSSKAVVAVMDLLRVLLSRRAVLLRDATFWGLLAQLLRESVQQLEWGEPEQLRTLCELCTDLSLSWQNGSPYVARGDALQALLLGPLLAIGCCNQKRDALSSLVSVMEGKPTSSCKAILTGPHWQVPLLANFCGDACACATVCCQVFDLCHLHDILSLALDAAKRPERRRPSEIGTRSALEKTLEASAYFNLPSWVGPVLAARTIRLLTGVLSRLKRAFKLTVGPTVARAVVGILCRHCRVGVVKLSPQKANHVLGEASMARSQAVWRADPLGLEEQGSTKAETEARAEAEAEAEALRARARAQVGDPWADAYDSGLDLLDVLGVSPLQELCPNPNCSCRCCSLRAELAGPLLSLSTGMLEDILIDGTHCEDSFEANFRRASAMTHAVLGGPTPLGTATITQATQRLEAMMKHGDTSGGFVCEWMRPELEHALALATSSSVAHRRRLPSVGSPESSRRPSTSFGAGAVSDSDSTGSVVSWRWEELMENGTSSVCVQSSWPTAGWAPPEWATEQSSSENTGLAARVAAAWATPQARSLWLGQTRDALAWLWNREVSDRAHIAGNRRLVLSIAETNWASILKQATHERGTWGDGARMDMRFVQLDKCESAGARLRFRTRANPGGTAHREASLNMRASQEQGMAADSGNPGAEALTDAHGVEQRPHFLSSSRGGGSGDGADRRNTLYTELALARAVGSSFFARPAAQTPLKSNEVRPAAESPVESPPTPVSRRRSLSSGRPLSWRRSPTHQSVLIQQQLDAVARKQRATVRTESNSRVFEKAVMIDLNKVFGGSFEVGKTHVKFLCDEPEPRGDGSAFVGKRWSLGSVRRVQRRRYNMSWRALELFTGQSERKSYFIALPSPEESVQAVKLISRAIQQADALLLPEERCRKSGAQEAWIKGDMSNLEYLMCLNDFAGRSYADLAQYPVLPWVLRDYTSEELDLGRPESFRDLRYPIGAQSEERRQELHDKFEETRAIHKQTLEQSQAEDGGLSHSLIKWTLGLGRKNELEERHGDMRVLQGPPWHFGSFCSTRAIVLWYLLRTEPYTTLHVELQGGRFDHADRQFHSVEGAYHFATAVTARELIPEFYCNPEFLRNVCGFDLGTKQNGVQIGDVVLPPWAGGSAERFVHLHREALESEHVSRNLHHWIDLMFGCKQRGPASEEALNVYFHLMYEGAVDMEYLEQVRPDLHKTVQRMVEEYGQSPPVLFSKPHPRRERCRRRIPRPLARAAQPTNVVPQLRRLVASWAVPRSAVVWLSAPLLLTSDPLGAESGGLTFSARALRRAGVSQAESVASRATRAAIFMAIDRSRGLRLLSVFDLAERETSLVASLALGELGAPLSFEEGLGPHMFAMRVDQGRDLVLPLPSLLDGVRAHEAEEPVEPRNLVSVFASGFWDGSFRSAHLELESKTMLSKDSAAFAAADDGAASKSGLAAAAEARRADRYKPDTVYLDHGDLTTCVAVSEDGEYVLTGSKDCCVCVWRLRGPSRAAKSPSRAGDKQLQLENVLLGHDNVVTSIAVRSDMDLVVSASLDGTCIVHTLESGAYLRSIAPSEPPSPPVAPLPAFQGGFASSLSPGWMWVGVRSGSPPVINIWREDDLTIVSHSVCGRFIARQAFQAPLYAFCYSVDGALLACGSRQGVVHVRDAFSLREVCSSPPLQSPVQAISTLPGPRSFIISCRDGSVHRLAMVDPRP